MHSEAAGPRIEAHAPGGAAAAELPMRVADLRFRRHIGDEPGHRIRCCDLWL